MLEVNNSILLDLDTVFDTRLSLLYAISEDLALEVVESNQYTKRIRDNFGNISSDVFRSLYKRRNKNILKFALPTNIIELVNDLMVKYATDANNTELPKLYINTYPYRLAEDEKIVMINVLGNLFKNCTFELLYMDPVNELTPCWVNENVQTVIMYDGLNWLENHNRLFNLIEHPLIDKTLIVPALLTGYLDKNIKITSKIFVEQAMSIKSLVKLLFTDVVYFNSITKK